MTLKASDSDGQLPVHDDRTARRIMRRLHNDVEDLIDAAERATLPRKGKKARESSSVQLEFELYDEDGNLIFG